MCFGSTSAMLEFSLCTTITDGPTSALNGGCAIKQVEPCSVKHKSIHPEEEMKVFIAGATGAVGRPLISRLVAAGHDVVGMTSSERGLQRVKENGAEGVIADALDTQAVQAAMN